jgi:uncharacterized protein (DUF2236 family)
LKEEGSGLRLPRRRAYHLSVDTVDPVVGRRINREAVVVLGWGRAVLLQLAHPLVAAGVGGYSQFSRGAGSFVRRARGTIGAMLTLTFGTPDEAQEVIDHINGIHDRVNGVLGEAVGPYPAGTPYSARDPNLLLWVHATLIESMVLTYEMLVGPLSAEDKDRYALEATYTTERLGVARDRIPAGYAAIQAYLADRYASGEIAVGPEARRVAAELLSPPVGPAAPAFRVTRLITIGLLPRHIREGYGYEWDERRERRFQRAISIIRTVRDKLPSLLRDWPAARGH